MSSDSATRIGIDDATRTATYNQTHKSIDDNVLHSTDRASRLNAHMASHDVTYIGLIDATWAALDKFQKELKR